MLKTINSKTFFSFVFLFSSVAAFASDRLPSYMLTEPRPVLTVDNCLSSGDSPRGDVVVVFHRSIFNQSSDQENYDYSDSDLSDSELVARDAELGMRETLLEVRTDIRNAKQFADLERKAKFLEHRVEKRREAQDAELAEKGAKLVRMALSLEAQLKQRKDKKEFAAEARIAAETAMLKKRAEQLERELAIKDAELEVGLKELYARLNIVPCLLTLEDNLRRDYQLAIGEAKESRKRLEALALREKFNRRQYK